MSPQTRGVIMNLDSDRHAMSGWCAILLMLAAAQFVPRATAEVIPARGSVDSRVRTTPYDSEQVYRVHGYVGYQIDFEFEPGETFIGLGAGDMEGLSYFGEGNHLFLKPKAAKVATNLTVLTNRRRYQIDYTAVPQRPVGDEDVIFALRFVYPPAPDGDRAARRIDTALENAPAKRHQNRDYWYCGSSTLRPIAASDDGVHTRIRFAANADLPALFVHNADGSESLLNFSMEEGDVVVHRVARQFVLRRGRLTGCIVNQGFGGSGLRLDSGTVAPEVERDVPGAVR
jgi:type IV secretion system protein VirB9